jgi:ABC-type multidrug transport system ATPase subunit
MSPKEPSLSVPHGSNDVDATSKSHDSASTSGYLLKWSRLSKTVEVKDMASGGLMGRSSIAGAPTTTTTDSSKTSGGSHSKTILHSITGQALPGQVLACMGPSGSGKTSLMNVLSGRSAYQTGTLSINDVVLESKRDLKKYLQPHVAYVKQNDVFFNHLTVRDQLTYTALLRLPKTTSLADKHKEVESIIEQLRLTKVADSPIKMVSGGERKRVNIGTELLTNPKVVLLDEPTSKS